ncbi:family 2 glycosyl transferase [Anabaenopsis circularis NIES-21]|uniref:Family 2 glycosyl transferase n=1 Tax=Anabaenopsis circularis NIES-21 TaxID=1085406 RepID=A0A1Z4GM17_9CYAN|nr:family 2 glycosyl transferase [Anabaenopsis circularis NIES-21]
MNPLISVVIPTHNPNLTRLQRTLDGLRSQSLSYSDWQLLIIDNASSNPDLFANLDLSWHPHTHIIREERLGLTRARIAGIQASQGKYIIFVDDDNVLCPNYLQDTINILHTYPHLGVIGGKSLPEFEADPEPWVKQFWGCLALRDLGDEMQIYAYDKDPNSEKQHPEFAPIGAGMALQHQAAQFYVNSILNDSLRLGLDRTGKSLQSGGDCDINLTLLDAGWGVGYFPQLQLTHLISINRLTKHYLARLNYSSSRSWVQVLNAHNIRPWKKIASWTVNLRKTKAFVSCQPWKSPAHYVEWQGACGLFEGLAMLK